MSVAASAIKILELAMYAAIIALLVLVLAQFKKMPEGFRRAVNRMWNWAKVNPFKAILALLLGAALVPIAAGIGITVGVISAVGLTVAGATGAAYAMGAFDPQVNVQATINTPPVPGTADAYGNPK